MEDDENECIQKLKKDEIESILEILKKINILLAESKLSLKKISLKSCS